MFWSELNIEVKKKDKKTDILKLLIPKTKSTGIPILTRLSMIIFTYLKTRIPIEKIWCKKFLMSYQNCGFYDHLKLGTETAVTLKVRKKCVFCYINHHNFQENHSIFIKFCKLSLLTLFYVCTKFYQFVMLRCCVNVISMCANWSVQLSQSCSYL